MLPRSPDPDTASRRLAPPARSLFSHPAPRARAAFRAGYLVVVILAPLAPPAGAAAQFRDARLPAKGELWFDLSGSLLNWDSQFAQDSPDSGIADGAREPLFRDYDGPLADRLFPGATSLIDGLNADADALGFDPVTPADFSLGRLDFGTINSQRRRLEVGFELGFLDRISLEARVPLAFAEVEASFAFDSASATVLPAVSAIPGSFITGFRAAVTDLDALIAGGTLSPADMTLATGLRDDATAFVDALERRIMGLLLIPTGLSPAGTQMISHVDSLIAGFELFDVALPVLPLPEVATSAEVGRLFTDPPVSGTVPGSSDRGWAMGEIEFGARFGILDQITHTLALDAAGPPEGPSLEPAQQPAIAGAQEPVGEPASTSDLAFVRLRTTVGAKVRLPSGSPNAVAYENPSDFVGIPIGDGQMDVELALYQDVAFGRRLLLSAAALYGLQLEDELTLRIRSPDRPFAFEGTQALVRRDLGDYLQVRLAPRFQLSGGMWVGFEYGLWHKGVDRYEFGPTLPGVEDATPLEVESEQRLNRWGVTFLFEPGQGARRPEIPSRTEGEDDTASGDAPETGGEERVRHSRRRTSGWRFAITLQRAASGSGGQTPASSLVALTMRFPIGIF